MTTTSQKGYSSILLIILLVIGLITGVYLVKKPTNIFPKAYDAAPNDIYSGAEDIIINSNGKFGISIDIFKPEKIPNTEQLQALSPGWVRFVVGPSLEIPTFPKNIKTMVVFNAESVVGRPKDAEFSENWRNYIDKYVQDLEDFIKKNPGKITAIEIWNEEDICDLRYDYCPGVPENIYAEILKRSASTIKQNNPDIKVIMGGLVTNDITWEDGGYLGRLLKIDPNIFDQVDALGLHPYGKTLNNWCSCNSKKYNKDGSENKAYCTTNIDPITDKDRCPDNLPWGDIKESVDKYKAALPTGVKIWVTEIGQPTDDYEWQKEYMKMVFDYLSTEAEVVNWYAWTDKMLAVEDVETDFMQMGLYDRNNNLKPAGILFKTYSTNN